MLDRLVEVFCEADDFCKAFREQFEEHLLGTGPAHGDPNLDYAIAKPSRSCWFCIVPGSSISKAFTTAPMAVLRQYFLGMPCYERFVAIHKQAFAVLAFFTLSRMGQKRGIYYIDSTALPVCHNRRINRHKTFAALAERGKTTMGWFFGFKLHLVFNDINEIVAFRLTQGNVSDTAPVPSLTRNLIGKLFGDKGYIGKKLAEELLRRGLALFTRVRKNMKSLPISMIDKALLNACNMAETIIGKIKVFSSLCLPRHRLPINGFLHILAAIAAYQINPIPPLDPYFQPALPTL